jgi:hypothetical protein
MARLYPKNMGCGPQVKKVAHPCFRGFKNVDSSRESGFGFVICKSGLATPNPSGFQKICFMDWIRDTIIKIF